MRNGRPVPRSQSNRPVSSGDSIGMISISPGLTMSPSRAHTSTLALLPVSVQTDLYDQISSPANKSPSMPSSRNSSDCDTPPARSSPPTMLVVPSGSTSLTVRKTVVGSSSSMLEGETSNSNS